MLQNSRRDLRLVVLGSKHKGGPFILGESLLKLVPVFIIVLLGDWTKGFRV